MSAFDEGLAGGGDVRDLQRALRELIKGDDAAADGKPDKAIKRYGKAWERARDSLG
ncbi:MAG: hypothetical protein ACYTJ0_05015 [Planctomycetota bacterium]